MTADAGPPADAGAGPPVDAGAGPPVDAGALADATHALTHAGVRARWGTPDEVRGSVNDPRLREEHGVSWNECWTWHLEGGDLRHVYWHRYAFRAALRERPDGSAAPEPT